MFARKDSVIDEAYKEPEDVINWLTCPDCQKKPWIWVFDNGAYAKCCCCYKYDHSKGFVEGECIGHIWRRDGNTLNYDRDNLRKAWNSYIENLV